LSGLEQYYALGWTRTGIIQDLIGIDSRVGIVPVVEMERIGRDPGRGVDFYISLQDLLSEKCLLDALKGLVA
jgi:hypothetical protein